MKSRQNQWFVFLMEADHFFIDMYLISDFTRLIFPMWNTGTSCGAAVWRQIYGYHPVAVNMQNGLCVVWLFRMHRYNVVSCPWFIMNQKVQEKEAVSVGMERVVWRMLKGRRERPVLFITRRSTKEPQPKRQKKLLGLQPVDHRWGLGRQWSVPLTLCVLEYAGTRGWVRRSEVKQQGRHPLGSRGKQVIQVVQRVAEGYQWVIIVEQRCWFFLFVDMTVVFLVIFILATSSAAGARLAWG